MYLYGMIFKDEFIEAIKQKRTFEPFVTGSPKVRKAFGLFLAAQQIPFKVVTLGGGVTRTIPAENVCTHCKGKGVV